MDDFGRREMLARAVSRSSARLGVDGRRARTGRSRAGGRGRMASAGTGNARAKTAVVVEDGEVKTSTWLRMKSVAALAGVVGTTAIQVAFPERASALSIRDPVFGDIEVWQFLVLTAGYFIGIEFYLDNKYDETKQPIMPSVQKKKEETEEEKAE